MPIQIATQVSSRKRLTSKVAAALMVIGAIGTTGCQMDVGGQTLPSPYYLYDDVQYFPPGPEFKLAREAAAMAAYEAGEDE